jgi:hypothetical protein
MVMFGRRDMKVLLRALHDAMEWRDSLGLAYGEESLEYRKAARRVAAYKRLREKVTAGLRQSTQGG